MWAGVELFNPVGLHNGFVDNVEYFCCEPRHGVFAPLWTLECVQAPPYPSSATLKREDDIAIKQRYLSISDIMHINN